MSENISPEQYRAEIAELNQEIFRLSRRLEEQEKQSALESQPRRQDPFLNPTEYHDSRDDYSKILPRITEPGCVVPLDPDREERRRLKRCYAVGGGCMLAHFIVSDYLASAILTVVMVIIKKMNPDADVNAIKQYVRASSILAGLTMLVYLLTNVGFASLGMKMNGNKKSELIRTRDFNFGKAVQYCFIGIFILFTATVSNIIIENIFMKYGYTTDVIPTKGMAVTNSGKLIMMLYTCIIAPVTEEIFFRGMILKSFSKASQRFGVLFSAVLFGLAHANIPQFLLAFMVGIFLAHITLIHGSLIPAMIVHAFVNSYSSLGSELDLSPKGIIVFNEIFIILAMIGLVFLLVFATKERLPATTPAQTRRGFSLAMLTPLAALALVLQVLYTMSLIFSSPFLDMIRTYL